MRPFQEQFGDGQPLLLLIWELLWGFGEQGTSCLYTTSPYPTAGPQGPLPSSLSPWGLFSTAAQPQCSGRLVLSLCSTLPSLDPRDISMLTGGLGSVCTSALKPRWCKCISGALTDSCCDECCAPAWLAFATFIFPIVQLHVAVFVWGCRSHWAVATVQLMSRSCMSRLSLKHLPLSAIWNVDKSHTLSCSQLSFLLLFTGPLHVLTQLTSSVPAGAQALAALRKAMAGIGQRQQGELEPRGRLCSQPG